MPIGGDRFTLEALLKRDRAVVLVGIAIISLLAWTYMAYLAWDMGQMKMDVAMPQTEDL